LRALQSANDVQYKNNVFRSVNLAPISCVRQWGIDARDVIVLQ